MYKCPYCDRKTIRFLDKLLFFYLDFEKCLHCRGEWKMTSYRLLYFVFAIPVMMILEHTDWLSYVVATAIYCMVIAMYPISKIHEDSDAS